MVKKSRILTYKDSDSLVSAADAFICQLAPDLATKKITILGDTAPGCKLAVKLAERGAEVTLWGEDIKRARKIAQGLNLLLPRESLGKIYASADSIEASKGANILVGILPYSPMITTQMVQVMQERGMVIDAGISTIYPDAIEYGISHRIHLYRLDMRAGLSGEITNVLESLELTSKVIGAEDYDGVRIVAGGTLGRKGDIVVDSISQPTRVIGVADGRGGLLEESEKERYQEKLVRIEAMIFKKKLG